METRRLCIGQVSFAGMVCGPVWYLPPQNGRLARLRRMGAKDILVGVDFAHGVRIAARAFAGEPWRLELAPDAKRALDMLTD